MEEIEKMLVGIIQKDYNTVNELDLDFDKVEFRSRELGITRNVLNNFDLLIRAIAYKAVIVKQSENKTI